MYFYDHTLIESTSGEKVPIVLNDKQWPEGLRFALGKMWKGEKSKVRIKKNYGFSSSLDPELLRVPESCKEGEMLQRLKKKGIIYEITLHDWDIRDDIEHDGTCVKIVTKRSKGAFDKPNGIDEVTINLKVYQEKEVIIHELTNFTGMLDDP